MQHKQERRGSAQTLTIALEPKKSSPRHARFSSLCWNLFSLAFCISGGSFLINPEMALAQNQAQDTSVRAKKTKGKKKAREKGKVTRKPKSAPAPELPVRGLTSYYLRASSGYELETTQKNDPANTNVPISDQKHKMLFGGVIGWGPIRANDLFFNVHYTYKQDWKTDQGQFTQFQNQWFQSPSAETFLFRTQDLLRSHELASDLRYIHRYFQAGVFSRFSLARVGSQLLGAEFEEARTVVKSENFVPYFSFRYGRYYRGQISAPFRTEINEDEKRLSNATYSLDSRGRGFLMSADMNNGFFIPSINSLIFLDLSYNQFKYASIQNDRRQIGIATSIDFPVIWRVRAAPKFLYQTNDFIADRVRIEGFKKTGSEGESTESPTLIARNDTVLGASGSLYADITKTQRLSVSFSINSTTSTIPEFNILQEIYSLTYSYAWPRTSLVQKRVQRFQENTYAEEF